MAKRDRLIPVAIAASACLCAGCAPWGVIRDGDGKITGIGPNVVSVSESPPSWLDIAADTITQPEVAAAASATGFGSAYLLIRGLMRSAQRKTEEQEQRVASARDEGYDLGRNETVDTIRRSPAATYMAGAPS